METIKNNLTQSSVTEQRVDFDEMKQKRAVSAFISASLNLCFSAFQLLGVRRRLDRRLPRNLPGQLRGGGDDHLRGDVPHDHREDPRESDAATS